MRWALGGMKAAIALVYLFAISMLVLAAAPLATGGLEVRVPEDVGQNWRLQGSYFYNPVELSLFNGGVLDIQGMVVRVELRDANGTLISTSYSPATQLASSQWSQLDINVSVDTNALSRDQLRDMVFNTTKMQMNMKVDADMALGMMSLALDRTGMDNFTKSSMISDIHIENEIHLSNVTGGMEAKVPFKLTSSQYLEGTMAHVDCIMRNSSAVFASVNQDIELHPSVSTTLDFMMNQAHADAFLANREPVRLEMTVSYSRAEMPFSFSIPYHDVIFDSALKAYMAAESVPSASAPNAMRVSPSAEVTRGIGEANFPLDDVRSAEARFLVGQRSGTSAIGLPCHTACTLAEMDHVAMIPEIGAAGDARLWR